MQIIVKLWSYQQRTYKNIVGDHRKKLLPVDYEWNYTYAKSQKKLRKKRSRVTLLK